MYDPSEALLQLGLYDYVWGNPSLLQTYNANVQAQKARDDQNRYNTLWKQIEMAKMQSEKEKANALKLNELNKEFDELQYKLTQTQDPLEIAWLNKQMRKVRADAAAQGMALRGEDKAFEKSYNDNRQYNEDLNVFKKGLKRNFKTEAEKNAELARIENAVRPDGSNFRDKDIIEMRKEISGIDSQQAKNEAAVSQSISSHVGKKTTEQLNNADLMAQANTAIATNARPSSLSAEVKQKIRELGYSWNGTQWVK